MALDGSWTNIPIDGNKFTMEAGWCRESPSFDGWFDIFLEFIQFDADNRWSSIPNTQYGNVHPFASLRVHVDIEEETTSDEEDDAYVETEEDEKDLKDNGVKEEECDYEIEEPPVPIAQPRVQRSQRSTRARLTHYEKVKVLSVRATQISLGAKVFVRGVENKSPLEIAELELEQGLIPFVIIRPFPDNTYESWKVSELVHNESIQSSVW